MFRALVAAALIGLAQAIPLVNNGHDATIVHPTPPGQVKHSTLDITKDTTINATAIHNPSGSRVPGATVPLHIALTNNFGGTGAIYAYIVGLNPSGVLFFGKGDGSVYYPPNPAAGIPPQEVTAPVAITLGARGSTINVNLNQFLTSGRIYFSNGGLHFYTNHGSNGPQLVQPSAANPSDPNAGTNWGFAELTYSAAGGLFADISYVDFIGLPIGIYLTDTSGGTQSAKGLPAGAANSACNAAISQHNADSQPWDKLCFANSTGTRIRLISPSLYISNVGSAFSSYYVNYVNDVFSHYTSTPLTIKQGGTSYTGQVNPSSGLMVFNNNGGTFSKPNANDIFGCNSGPFANAGSSDHLFIVPRLCAAFARSTLLLSGGNVTPDGITDYSKFYSVSPTHHFSRIAHSLEVDGKGYAFPYDDVHPSTGPDLSGTVASGSPGTLRFTVGGPS